MPADGLEFGFEEAMEHLQQAKSQLPLITYWIENGWLPVSEASCLGGHRQSIALGDEFMAACLELEDDNSMVLTRPDIGKVLRKLKEKSKAGTWIPEEGADVSDRTRNRYFAYYCSMSQKRLRYGKVQQKMNTRYTAEHSLMTASTFAAVASVVCLNVGNDTRPRQFKKSIEKASKGAQRLHQIVSDANPGQTVYPKQPGMLTTFDDTTVYACCCLLYTSPSPRDLSTSRMPSSA